MALLVQQQLQGVCLALGVHQQRGTRHMGLAQPDRLVLHRRGARAQRHDDAVQQRQPGRARDLHHTRVGQELLEVAADRLRRWRIRRAKVDQQDGRARRLAMLVGRFGSKRHVISGVAGRRRHKARGSQGSPSLQDLGNRQSVRPGQANTSSG